MLLLLALLLAAPAWRPQFTFLHSPLANEMLTLRWLHIIFGIIWIGLLYFFNLVLTPAMKKVDPSVRVKLYPELMSRAMNWFRWSALVTVLVGLRYFQIHLSSDAHNAGDPALVGRWFGLWLLLWFSAYAFLYVLQLPAKGFLDNPWLRAIGVAIVVIGASWVSLMVNASKYSSSAHLSISIGGGIGLWMLLNTWGVVWRAQKRLIAWTRAASEQGAPLPPEADRFMRWSFLTARTSFWLSFPMLFFMAAASHYPFLSSVPS